MRFSKGAPQVIVDLCQLDDETAAKANGTVADLAARGLRALGIAESTDEGKTWSFLGILSMLDPPRDDSKETIEHAKEHGLQVKMVTGDDVAIGSQISGQLGMGTHLIAAADMFTKDMDMSHLPEPITENVERADGFGRVFPEHKYGIVHALQDRGHVVAMTGDGVNDAPALKQADCGIAVSGATDAARRRPASNSSSARAPSRPTLDAGSVQTSAASTTTDGSWRPLSWNAMVHGSSTSSIMTPRERRHRRITAVSSASRRPAPLPCSWDKARIA